MPFEVTPIVQSQPDVCVAPLSLHQAYTAKTNAVFEAMEAAGHSDVVARGLPTLLGDLKSVPGTNLLVNTLAPHIATQLAHNPHTHATPQMRSALSLETSAVVSRTTASSGNNHPPDCGRAVMSPMVDPPPTRPLFSCTQARHVCTWQGCPQALGQAGRRH